MVFMDYTDLYPQDFIHHPSDEEEMETKIPNSLWVATCMGNSREMKETIPAESLQFHTKIFSLQKGSMKEHGPVQVKVILFQQFRKVHITIVKFQLPV